MFEQAFKNIYDVLRKEAGCATELDYIEQISWLLFLKYLDDLEREREAAARLDGKRYADILDKPYRWDEWAAPRTKLGQIDHDRALTGDDLLDFVNDRLFPYLHGFIRKAASPSTIEYKIGEIFREIKNRIRSGDNLRQLIGYVDELRLRSPAEKHELAQVYEASVRNMAHSGYNGGEHYTPRPLIRAIVQVLQPTVGDRIYDPACGSAGFLGKKNPINDDDLTEFVELQTTFANSPRSWSVDVKSIDKATLDLSAKNPSRGEELAGTALAPPLSPRPTGLGAVGHSQLEPADAAVESYAVFLSHHSSDKTAVRELFLALQARGISAWFDEEHLVPGRPWQAALETLISSIPAALVVVGQDGIGPWENMEMRAILTQFVRRKIPVIPVLLPGAPHEPQLPLMLSEFTWVDLRAGLSNAGLNRLIWGITGRKPVEGESPEPVARAIEPQRSSPTPSPIEEPHPKKLAVQELTKSARIGISLAVVAAAILLLFILAIPRWENREILSRTLIPCPSGEPIPITSTDSLSTGYPTNPGFTVMAEERVWDLRRLTPSEGGITGRSCLTRYIELRRDSVPARSFEIRVDARAATRFSLISDDPRLSMNVLGPPTEDVPRLGPGADLLRAYKGILDCSQLPVGERFSVEIQVDSRDTFRDRSEWWTGMIVGDDIEHAAMRIIFPSRLPFHSPSFRRYPAGDRLQSVPFEGSELTLFRAQPELVWTANHPPKGIYRVSWDW